MRKVLITQEHRPLPDTIVVPLPQANHFLQALKDSHFEQVTLELSQTQFNNNKLFIYIPRVLRQGGLLTIQGLSKQDQQKISNIIIGLGLKPSTSSTEQQITFTKPAPELEKTETLSQQSHIGFHAGVKVSTQPEKIDEADLLKGDVVVKKSKPEDCAVKPKACANCKCGRKEQEQKEQQQENQQSKEEIVKQIQEGTVKSNCGSCYLGDAFRCATCPYKGLPAFKPGDKIEIPSGDVVGEMAEETGTKVEGGKVRLEI